MIRNSSKIIIPLLALFMFITHLACNESQGKLKDEGEQKKTVQIDTIGRQDVSEILHYVADLEPYSEVQLYSPVPDRIIRFPWNDGDKVQKGQLIAMIRKEGLVKGIEQIAAQMEALDVQINNLEKELERSKGLLKAGVITRQVFEQVQTSYLSTKAQRRALEASKGQLAVNVNNAFITAPISGVIAGKSLEVGDMASPQIPLCRILDISRLRVELKLLEADVQKVGVGQTVTISLDAFPDKTFTGELKRIMPYLNSATRTNSAEVVLKNTKDPETGRYLLKPGMFGTAKLVVSEKKQTLVAPLNALLLDNHILSQQKAGEKLRKAFVVDENNMAHKRVVRIGLRKGNYAEVLNGLNEGEKLVTRGQHTLKDKEAVKIVSNSLQ